MCKLPCKPQFHRYSNYRSVIFYFTVYYNSKEFELHWGAVFFKTRRGVLENAFFKINFIGVNFEVGNETREKIWSDFVAVMKHMF